LYIVLSNEFALDSPLFKPFNVLGWKNISSWWHNDDWNGDGDGSTRKVFSDTIKSMSLTPVLTTLIVSPPSDAVSLHSTALPVEKIRFTSNGSFFTIIGFMDEGIYNNVVENMELPDWEFLSVSSWVEMRRWRRIYLLKWKRWILRHDWTLRDLCGGRRWSGWPISNMLMVVPVMMKLVVYCRSVYCMNRKRLVVLGTEEVGIIFDTLMMASDRMSYLQLSDFVSCVVQLFLFQRL